MFELRSLCRTCGIKLKNESSSTKLFEKSNFELIRLIEDITDMFLEFENSMPERICHECKEELHGMLAFRSKFLKVHQSFLATKRKHLQCKENYKKMEADSSKDEPGFFEGSFEDEDHIDEDKLDQEHDDEHTEKIEPAREEQEEDDGRNVEELSASCQNDEKIAARKAKQAKRNAKTWVCEQCGGVFKCSTYLKLHMLRHTGQKSFTCDVCQAKYYTENEMRRHRILHTDARPYACRFCDKTFRGCSSKVVHERTHTNERPFQCQYCEMAFTSTSTRQRHELLHTNNRKYHCETCQQWFLRATHLTLHQNTKLHKKRVANARKRCA
ncbi:hypothetical protein KR032_009488 [Drosophila birchii]|nr:hypothetical protein KR032_009488 [Drosophila birchii]